MNLRDQNQIFKEVKKYMASNTELLNNILDVELGYKVSDNDISDEISIRFIVKKKLTEKEIKALDHVHEIPKTILGFQTDILAEGETELESYDKRFEPLQGCVEIRTDSLGNNYGTMSCILKDSNNMPYGLSCYHVIFGRGKAGIGKRILQPGDDRTKGKISIVKEIPRLHLLKGQGDIAVFPINGRPISNLIHPFNKRLKFVKSPIIGLKIKKSGRTTGVTYGKICSISVINRWDIRIAKNLQKMSNDSILTDKGDSGALWVLDTANGNFLHGVAIHKGSVRGNRKVKRATSLKYICTKFKIKP